MSILKCGSSSRDFLAPFGYGTLALPKADVVPLTMLTKRGDRLTPVGSLAEIFRPGEATLPETTRGVTANLSGSASDNVDISVGLDILGAAIGALSGSTLGIKAAYQKARTVKFEFSDVMETKVAISALDRYLSTAQVDPNIGPFLEQHLNDDKIYVIVAVVDARQISVEATGKDGLGLELSVPVVQQLVGGKVAVNSSGATSSLIKYTSTEKPLAFGVQVVRLDFDKGLYRTLKLVKASDTRLATAGQQIVNTGADENDTAIIVPAELIEF